MFYKLLNDESGFLISAELVLIFTLVFCAVAVGVGVVKDSLAAELGDVAEAIGALNQTYSTSSLNAPTGTGDHATCAGSGFVDRADTCDCQGITVTLVTGKDQNSTLALEGAN